ncbi:MAG: carbon-nitrogen hydrolase family protein [Planctomycetes bacterium]|nr:carbon-nitrogen hydrolase family protein [Planctomycetota bacterium]
MFTTVPVAALTFRPKKWAKAENADKLESFFREAARARPRIIVAPEGILDGYIFHDVLHHPEKTAALLDVAEPIDGSCIRRFQKLARALRSCLCFGFAERKGRAVYNAAAFIDHRGRLCGRQHKHEEPVTFAGDARAAWSFHRRGRRLHPIPTPFGPAGILICADRWNPHIARTLVLGGARFLLVPTFGSKETSQTRTLLRRARENGVPVVQANVGMALIISHGELTGYTWGCNRVLHGNIDIPAAPSRRAARDQEREYLRQNLMDCDTESARECGRLMTRIWRNTASLPGSVRERGRE